MRSYCAVLCRIALNSIYFGTFTCFATVIAIATEDFYLSYAMPLLVRILARFTGRARVLPGPYTLGKWAIWLNSIGLLFLTFAAITFNFPSVAPVNEQNMNYCSAAIGVIGLVTIVTWVVDGRKNFRGPDAGGVLNASQAEDRGLGLSVKKAESHERKDEYRCGKR
jgi:choline transport protein